MIGVEYESDRLPRKGVKPLDKLLTVRISIRDRRDDIRFEVEIRTAESDSESARETAKDWFMTSPLNDSRFEVISIRITK